MTNCDSKHRKDVSADGCAIASSWDDGGPWGQKKSWVACRNHHSTHFAVRCAALHWHSFVVSSRYVWLIWSIVCLILDLEFWCEFETWWCEVTWLTRHTDIQTHRHTAAHTYMTWLWFMMRWWCDVCSVAYALVVWSCLSYLLLTKFAFYFYFTCLNSFIVFNI